MIMITFGSLEIYASSICHHFRWIIRCHYEGLTFFRRVGWIPYGAFLSHQGVSRKNHPFIDGLSTRTSYCIGVSPFMETPIINMDSLTGSRRHEKNTTGLSADPLVMPRSGARREGSLRLRQGLQARLGIILS